MEICLHCNEPILPNEMWLPVNYVSELGIERRFQHVECALRIVAGSVGHQLKECSCFGGTREDPPNMSKRQAAKLAYDLFLTIEQYRQAYEPSDQAETE